MGAGVATAWKSHRLASVVDQALTGFASGEDVEDGLLQVRMNNITTDGTIDWTKRRRVPPPNSKKGAPFVKAGDVLFNHTNSPDLVGKSAYFSGFSEAVTYSNHFICLSPRENALDGNYLARWLQQQWQGGCFRSMCKQWVNQATVGKDSLLNLEIPLPPLEEQKRIAAILDQADDIRRKRKHAIDRLNQLGQAIFHEMFGDLATNPMGWQIGKIDDLTASTQYGTSSKAGESGEYPILRMGNLLYSGEMDFSALKFIDFPANEVEKYTVRSGDILFNRTNSPDLVGKTSVYYGKEPMGFAGYLVRLRVNDRAVPEFISAYLNSGYGKAILRGMCKAIIGMANINAKELRGIPIPLPPIKLQQEFNLKITAMRDKYDAPKAHLRSLDRLFASLQHRAFAGEL